MSSSDGGNKPDTEQLALELSKNSPTRSSSVSHITSREIRAVRAEAIQHVIKSGIFEPPKTKLR